MSKNVNNKTDEFITLIGEFGRWQLVLCILMLLIKFPTGSMQLSILFMTPKTIFWCDRDNATVNTCYEYCVKYKYDSSPFVRTIVSEWDLVCDRQWLSSFTQTVLILGVLIGSVLFGFLADRYGRKKPLLLTIIVLITFALASPFSPNYETFTTLRFGLGLSLGGILVISFVLLMENVGSKYRDILGCIFQIPFMLGEVALSVYAFYFRSWESYLLGLAIPCLVFLGYFLVLPESPRWLVSVGRVDEAADLVAKIAKINKIPTTNIKESLTKISEKMTIADTEKPKVNYLDLVKTPFLRLKTLCCCLLWFISGLELFGVQQYISQTSSNPFVTVAVASGIQIPSSLLAIWMLKSFGRRTVISTFSILGGSFLCILGFTPNIFAINLSLGSLGTGCAAIVGSSIYIYASESFPTVVRNMGMGLSSTFMRLGSMVAPFIANLTYTKWLPAVVFGVAGIFAGFVSWFMPETKGKAMPNSIEDVELDTRN